MVANHIAVLFSYFCLLLDPASYVVQYVLGCNLGLQCNKRLANTSEKFLLLHTCPCKPINSNRWVYVHLGSFFNLGLDRIDSHLYVIQTLLQVTVPFSPLFG